jgi:uncharacterized DUF497 family protein
MGALPCGADMGETDDFEWDDMKDAANRQNRGLPLPLAARLFDGRPRIDAISSKSSPGEVRFETMAEFEGNVLFCVWTWNGDRRRIISLRIAHRSERRAYQEAIRGGGSSGQDN